MDQNVVQKTQVAKKSYELPVYITLSMQILNRVSTKLALRFALKLFFTPLKFPRPQRENQAFQSSTKTKLKTKSGEQFELHRWGDSPKKILLVHGWSGRGTQFFQIINSLLERDYELYAIDAPGHGNSTKKQTNLLEFVECIEEVHKNFGPFQAAIGHSLGGAAILNSLEWNTAIPKIVTVGTPSRIKHVVRDFCEKVKADSKIADRIIEYIENNYNVLSEEISPDYLASKYDPEGLVIHDELDMDISVQEARILHESWSNSKLIISEGLGHRKVLNDKHIVNEIIEFIEN